MKFVGIVKSIDLSRYSSSMQSDTVLLKFLEDCLPVLESDYSLAAREGNTSRLRESKMLFQKVDLLLHKIDSSSLLSNDDLELLTLLVSYNRAKNRNIFMLLVLSVFFLLLGPCLDFLMNLFEF